ncbi:hypothetical protein VTN77DRAFT_2397 [Rasamsonia byssochlamydoides]|uniref:uncharacterized protein n=1 Tax=Rasamsonia byssochlamydoides TaxID=89139 RepID=UPI0037434136
MRDLLEAQPFIKRMLSMGHHVILAGKDLELLWQPATQIIENDITKPKSFQAKVNSHYHTP